MARRRLQFKLVTSGLVTPKAQLEAVDPGKGAYTITQTGDFGDSGAHFELVYRTSTFARTLSDLLWHETDEFPSIYYTPEAAIEAANRFRREYVYTGLLDKTLEAERVRRFRGRHFSA